MNIVNLSTESLGKLHSWIPHDLKAETIVFLPDACPGKSPLPTGTAVLTYQKNWRKFAISDCGCGMRLLRSQVSPSELNRTRWDQIANLLRSNKNSLGDLGGGNHFLDALEPYDDGPLYFLIHTGSRHESGHVDQLVEAPDLFDKEFTRVVKWAADNRAAIEDAIAKVVGSVECVLDLPHNSYQVLEDGAVLIRKGSVSVAPNDLTILPSHMSGDVVMVRATNRVDKILNSLSHGTGRTMSRSDCKPLAETFDFTELRRQILIPSGVNDASLKTEGPFAYRDLDDCLALIKGYVEPIMRFAVVAYMGHL